MDIVQEVLSFSRDYVNGHQTQERNQKIAAAYLKVTGEKLRIGCKTCMVEAIFTIKHFMEKKPCKYVLKPGALLRAFGDESRTCTNKNLTDELAEYHLRTNPGCVKLFSVLPPVEEPPKELVIVPVDATKAILLEGEFIPEDTDGTGDVGFRTEEEVKAFEQPKTRKRTTKKK